MKIDLFRKAFPVDLEGFTIGKLRMAGEEVKGFVLVAPKQRLSQTFLARRGERRFILRIGADSYIEEYW